MFFHIFERKRTSSIYPRRSDTNTANILRGTDPDFAEMDAKSVAKRQPTFRSHLRQRIKDSIWGADLLAERAKLAKRIRECEVDGKVSFNVWSRDCDMCEGTSGEVIPALVMDIERRIQVEYDNAEGPVNCWVDTPAERAESHSRDLALEAFEDGHPWVVHP